MKTTHLGKTSRELDLIANEITDLLTDKGVTISEMAAIGNQIIQMSTMQLMLEALNKLGLEHVSSNNIEATISKMEHDINERLKDVQ